MECIRSVWAEKPVELQLVWNSGSHLPGSRQSSAGPLGGAWLVMLLLDRGLRIAGWPGKGELRLVSSGREAWVGARPSN